MTRLLQLSTWIDALNERIALAISWALLVAVLICAGNALVRYLLNTSSNAWLEIQWYLFGANFLLTASYTLRRNEHVRIDVLVSRFPPRTQAWVDILGFLLFLLPAALLILYLSVPYALDSIASREVSSNAGGLMLWPAKVLIPIGFLLLTLQGVSELIKRIGFLCGRVDAAVLEKQGPPLAGHAGAAAAPAARATTSGEAA